MINFRLSFYTSSITSYFAIELTIHLHNVNLDLEIGSRVKGKIIYLSIKPKHVEWIDGIPVNFVNQVIAIACGGRGYTGYGGDIFWFPTRRQKEHFLFLIGHRLQEITYVIEPDETLDSIPF